MECSTQTLSGSPRSPFAFFRDGVFLSFTRAGDALMNLADALVSEPQARSLPELSLSPGFVRRWPSVYEALQDAVVSRFRLRRVLAAFVPAPPSGTRRVLGLDSSSMARPASPTARDRTSVYAPNLPAGCKPVTVGWQFSSLVVLPNPASNPVYGLDTLRIPSEQTPAQVGAAQLAFIVPLLSARPLLLADRHYSSAAFVQATCDLACDQLLRLPKHRVLYRPAPLPIHKPGRPALDGARFQGKDPATHGPPDTTWAGTEAAGQPVTVSVWHNLHLRQCRDVNLSVVRVERPQAPDSKRAARVSWFLFRGQALPPLSEIVGLYARRYAQEHGFRFAKQALLWQTPRLRTPEQMQVWTDLVTIAQATLVLARPLVSETRRAWERKSGGLTSAQVRRGVGKIIAELGTPSRPPQQRGKAPGRLLGARVTKAPRFPVVRKTLKKPKKTHEKV